MDSEKLKSILESHKRWMAGDGGKRANLHCADLSQADLCGVKNIPPLIAATLCACPDSGSFIGWKKCREGVIVKLLIPEESRRSSATDRKCRAEFVDVLEVIGSGEGHAIRSCGVVYRAGEQVVCDEWDKDRWNECSGGIHFFITRAEAEAY